MGNGPRNDRQIVGDNKIFLHSTADCTLQSVQRTAGAAQTTSYDCTLGPDC